MELLLKSTDDKLFQLELAKLEITKIEKVIENNIQPIALKDCFTFLKSLYVVESYYMDFLRFDVIRTFDELNITEPQSIVLLLEYSNLKAKRHDKSCYIIKAALTYHAYMNGANVTYSNKNNTFSIYTKETGIVSIHDPNNTVSELFNVMGIIIEEKDIPWSGIYRQKYALEILFDEELRKYVSEVTGLDIQYTHDNNKIHNQTIEEKVQKLNLYP